MTKLKYIVALLVLPFTSLAQIEGDCTAPYNTANALVDILVSGVPYSNATLTGFDCSVGYFNGANSNIALDAGLVMATGGVESIAPGGGGSNGGASVEPDLTQQLIMVNSSATNVNNVIVLEFDFVPNSDQISFQYVFSSHEYPGYTCSNFNDIFGFFLSGPGINGPFSNDAINLAMVPDPDNPGSFTDTPVMINSINSGTPSGGNSGPCDQIDPNWQDYSVFFTDNGGTETVAFPGFTVPLTATAEVTPCETYHIKLAIADVSDGILNSAVFLLENSFTSIGVTVEPGSDYSNWVGNDTTILEGCFSGELLFELSQALSTDYVIDFEVSGSATNGVDYVDVGNQVLIPAGETQVSIPIEPLYDGVVEGIETVVISAWISDGCQEELRHYSFNIDDRQELYMEALSDTAFCPGDNSINLVPNLAGGVDPITYTWLFNGLVVSNDLNLNIGPTDLGTFTFTASDICDSELFDQMDVILREEEEALALVTDFDAIQICLEDFLDVDVLSSGGVGDLSLEWYLGDQVYNEGNSLLINTNFPYDYDFTLLLQDECSNELSKDIQIEVAPCWIPNVFTPNGDFQNDFWFVEFGDIMGNVRLDIFNRWGQSVYSSVNYELCDKATGDHCWDGTHMLEREMCSDGVYFYTFEQEDGRRTNGYITLLKDSKY